MPPKGRPRTIRLNKRQVLQKVVIDSGNIDNIRRIATIKHVDQIKNFNKYSVRLNIPMTDLEGFYEFILFMNDYFAEETGDDSVYISVLFNPRDDVETDGKVLARAFTANDLPTFDTFNDRLNALMQGKAIGSDAINADAYEMDMNVIVINTYSIVARARGKPLDMVFKVVGIESKNKKQCVKECFASIGLTFDDTDLQKVINHIIDKELPINIISNTFNIKKGYKELLADAQPTIVKIEKEKRGVKFFKNHYCVPLSLDDVNVRYLLKQQGLKPKHTFIYDEIKQHLDIIPNNKIELENEIYLCAELNVIKKDRIIYKPKQINDITENNQSVKPIYLFFDYETVIDYDHRNIMKEYSLSILVLDEIQLEALEKADKENDTITVATLREQCCSTFLGHDCSIQFIKWILDNQHNCNFTLIGFNNSNFDNFLLLDALLRNEKNSKIGEYAVNNIFYNGSQLLNFTINGRHNTFDIRKHLIGSLKSNCKGFKINCCAKKNFDHYKSQQLYDEGKLIEFITDNNELKEYNEYDVLATAVLYKRYCSALQMIPATLDFAGDLSNTKTIGSLIYKVFDTHCKTNKIKFPKLKYDYYRDLQSSKIAGRVEMFNGIQKINERVASTDVCSLYPYVMSVLDCYYPAGEIKDVVGWEGDRLGFYYCDIDQRCLKDKNLPNIYAYKTGVENQWDYKGVIENYLLSNVMIQLLLDFGCDVKIRNGFVFTEQIKSCEMFKFLLDIMKAKNEQDGYKDSKDEEQQELYNPALRETMKLLMNSLSGKVIEGLHTEKVEDIQTDIDYLEIKAKAKSINVINSIGDRIFVSYEVEEKDICEKEQRPIYLGVLIYDYAKRYMYTKSYSKIGLKELIYTDTDASKFSYEAFKDWKTWVEKDNVIVPHWKEVEQYDERYKNHLIYQADSKVFGSFEDELAEYIGEEYQFICVEKKSWLYAWKKGDSWKNKYRFKGLNDRALLLTMKEDFIKKKKMTKDGKPILKVMMKQEMDYKKVEDYQNQFKNINKYYNENPQLYLGVNAIPFFDKLFQDKHIYTLVSSFRKIVKNSARNVEIEDELQFNSQFNKIEVHYMIKKITLKSNEDEREE